MMGRDKEDTMADERVVVALDGFELRLLVNGLNGFRTNLQEEGLPTEDVDDLILKVINAPTKKQKRQQNREAR